MSLPCTPRLNFPTMASRRVNASGDRVEFAYLSALCAIFAVGVVVRVCLLSQPMRNDEALTFLYYSSKPLSMALSDYSLPNNHLFHTFLVRLAYLLLGNEPWSLRLPAFIAGTLLIPAAYLLAHRLYNRHAALLSAALVACSSILIEFTTNARGYTLICLITLLVFALATILY